MNLDPHLHKFLDGLTVSLDPVARFRAAMGFEPRGFQRELLTSTASHPIALASRQLGKSTAVACVAWNAFLRDETVVAICPHEKQAKEFLLRVKEFRDADPFALAGIRARDGVRNVLVRPALDEEVESALVIVRDCVLADGGDEVCF